MTKEILVRFTDGRAEVALTNNRRLEEIHLIRQESQQLLGNIYLGRVQNVLPGMQAAFVDIGLEKNSFLYVEDALPIYNTGKTERGDKTIDQLVKKDQQVVVQIFKESAGTKGARVTMRPSLPGRYLVLLPRGDYVAVSRRISDEGERERLREIMRQELPDGMGVIVRTVAEGADKDVLSGELRSLIREWRRVLSTSSKKQAPTLLYEDNDLLKKAIRDANPQDVDAILAANEEDFRRIADVIDTIAPALKEKLVLRESRDLFLDYDIRSQVEQATHRKVWLKSGGYIIIDQMEALTAIDVNTGKYVGESNLNDTVSRTNQEAAVEVARQLRLRNIGGIVIIDFIDMDNDEDKASLIAALEEETGKDRVRVTVMGMTQLGLVELTRKKVGHDLSSMLQTECPACNGTGRVNNLPKSWK